MEKLSKEKQDKIESIVEELTSQKFEKIAELKATYEAKIKKLEL